MEKYCDNCQTTTSHEETITTHLPDYVPKYTYPFEHRDALKCTECETVHKKQDTQKSTPTP